MSIHELLSKNMDFLSIWKSKSTDLQSKTVEMIKLENRYGDTEPAEMSKIREKTKIVK